MNNILNLYLRFSNNLKLPNSLAISVGKDQNLAIGVIPLSRRGINCFECTLYMLNLSTFHNNLVIVFVWGRLPCKS